jgi:pSer/pThr/pTyr-binding forkhead associated (FHA) protein
MASPPQGHAAGTRRPAADIIDAVLENMRTNLEPLKYSILAPSRFVVYLHPDEYARVEPILSILQSQTTRALNEELERLNRRPAHLRYLERFRPPPAPVENAAREWQIEFLPDADGELAPGDILIHSELAIPGADDELGAGQRTRRITTKIHDGRKTTRRHEVVAPAEPAKSDALIARLQYDDASGSHTFEITADSITIGRGGIAYHTDVKIDASVDVSREHARIRRDPASGRFFLIDLSTLGTSVNGQRVPRGYEETDGVKRENGAETALTDGARIGLADAIVLQFLISGRS